MCQVVPCHWALSSSSQKSATVLAWKRLWMVGVAHTPASAHSTSGLRVGPQPLNQGWCQPLDQIGNTAEEWQSTSRMCITTMCRNHSCCHGLAHQPYSQLKHKCNIAHCYARPCCNITIGKGAAELQPKVTLTSVVSISSTTACSAWAADQQHVILPRMDASKQSHE